jgi:outer membrane protein TolC
MKQSKPIKTWLSVAILLASLPAAAQQTNAFSVQQAADYALQHSVTVRNALLDIKNQQQVNRGVTSAALPQLNASVATNIYLDIPVSLIPGEIFGGTPGSFIPVQFGTKYNANGSVELSQLLFDGQVFVGLQARRASMEFYERQADVTKEQIKTNVHKIYYQLVVGKKQLAALDASITRIEKLLSDTKAYFENGFAERLDIDKVTVQLNNLKTQRLSVENQINMGYAGLKFLIGMPQKDQLELTDTLTEDKLKENLLVDSINYSDRKEYQLLQVAERLNKYNVRRYKLSYLPSLAAFASYSKNAQRQDFSFLKDGSWFTTSLVGFKLNIPIFDGFAKKANLERARIGLKQTQNNMEQFRESVNMQMQQAKLKITTALQNVDNQKKNRALAEQVFNTTKIKYQQGLGSNNEIYAAQLELSLADSNYFSALYDAIIARIDYLQAIGKL